MFFFFCMCRASSFLSFFFNDTATTEIYTLSLHDALPISITTILKRRGCLTVPRLTLMSLKIVVIDGSAGMPRSEERFSRNAETISYAVFCLKKKKEGSRNFHSPTLTDTQK